MHVAEVTMQMFVLTSLSLWLLKLWTGAEDSWDGQNPRCNLRTSGWTARTWMGGCDGEERL